VVLSLFAVAGRGALAGPIETPGGPYCTDKRGAEIVYDLIVPSGASCRLIGTEVRGSVIVEPNAALAVEGAAIRGSLTVNGALHFDFGSLVEGDVWVSDVTHHSSLGGGSIILGSLTLSSNAFQVGANSLYVGGNLTVVGNTGGVYLNGNVVGLALACDGNDPAPTGEGNSAGSRFKDQCQRL
jgi:hypothetical protein